VKKQDKIDKLNLEFTQLGSSVQAIEKAYAIKETKYN
jgi:hypothetical protein